MTKEVLHMLEFYAELAETEIKYVIEILKEAECSVPDRDLRGKGWHDATSFNNTRVRIEDGLEFLQEYHRELKWR